MEKEISEDELKTIVYKSKNNKSPGPDGFSNEFYKIFWTQIKILLLKLIKFLSSKRRIEQSTNKWDNYLYTERGKNLQ